MADGPIRVLLVEDNPADARLLREALSEAPGFHFDVEHARGLDAGIAAVAARPFDVVLLDLGLPESHGLDTLQRVHGIGSELPIVVITGLDDEETGLRAVQMGAQGYLIKGDLNSRALSRSLRHAIERHRMVAELDTARRREHYLATHDALTGLPNRQLLFDLLSQTMAYCTRYGQWAAVLFVDLDRFKQVNDTLGHDAGDRLLQTVAERLTRVIRTSDTAARLGGDEFIVLLSNMNRTQDAFIVARAILRDLSQPVVIGEHQVTVTPSIGIAIYPGDGTRPEALVRSADAAMYSAKRNGGRTYQFFSAQLGSSRPERKLGGEALRHALAVSQLRLYYQPQVDSCTGKVEGAEALLRWHHPEHGLLSPGAFLPVAESEGLMAELTAFTLRAACEQARGWRSAGRSTARLAVNVAPSDLQRGDLASVIEAVLADTGADAGQLEIELPLAGLTGDLRDPVAALRRLREIGVHVSLDEAGTGTAWKQVLHDVPLGALKVDGGLVRGLGRDRRATEAVTAVLEAAEAAGIDTVGAGVETQDQLDGLRSRRCRRVQGFYFSQALPATDFGQILRDGVLPDVEPAA